MRQVRNKPYFMAVLALSLSLCCSELYAQKKISLEMRNRNIVANTTGMNLDANSRPELSYGMDVNAEWDSFWNKSITPSLGLNVNRADYSHYKIRQKNKEEKTLASPNQLVNEYMLSMNFAYAKDVHGVNLSLFSHLGDAYFKRRGLSMNYDFSFNEKWSMVGIKGLLFQQDRPFGYYLEGAKLRPYPDSILGRKVSFYYQQIFPWELKAKWEVFSGQRKRERPVHLGSSIKIWKAITDRLYARLEGTYSEEKRKNFSSQDGRGHFQLVGGSVQLTLEPLIGVLITGMYGQTVERETQLSLGSYVQTGLDQFGLGISFETLSNKYQLKWNRLSLSNGKEQVGFSGGISWDL